MIERTRKKRTKSYKNQAPPVAEALNSVCSLLCRKIAALLPQISLELALRSALWARASSLGLLGLGLAWLD